MPKKQRVLTREIEDHRNDLIIEELNQRPREDRERRVFIQLDKTAGCLFAMYPRAEFML